MNPQQQIHGVRLRGLPPSVPPPLPDTRPATPWPRSACLGWLEADRAPLNHRNTTAGSPRRRTHPAPLPGRPPPARRRRGAPGAGV